MAVYQVGVVISVSRVTDVLVRVEAPSEQDAQVFRYLVEVEVR